MALIRYERYPGRFEVQTSEQPQGAFKNRTSATSNDGSFLEKDWLNDQSAFFSSLLASQGVEANGLVDEVGASQYFDELTALIAANQAAIGGAYKNLASSASGLSDSIIVTADSIIVAESGQSKRLDGVSVTIDGTTVGADGLDSGVLASDAWYATFVIWDGDTVSGLMSTSLSPSLPPGYTHLAHIGWIRTDSTASKYPLSFIQNDADFQYKTAVGSNLTTLPTMASGINGLEPSNFSAVAVGSFVPPNAKKIKVFGGDTGTSGGSVMIAPNSTYRYIYGGGLSSNPAPIQFNPSGTSGFGAVNGEMVLEESNIYFVGSTAGCVLKCLGFTI